MTKKNQTDWKVIVTGLVCVTVLEAIALMKGINGTLFMIVIGLIATTIGVNIDKATLLKLIKGK
jgi:hypothetical protein